MSAPTTHRPAMGAAEPRADALVGDLSSPSPAGPDSPPAQGGDEAQPFRVGRGPSSDRAARLPTRPIARPLLDPTLLIAAEIVDDLEKTRVANENRLRQLTRDVEDADGEERGFGLTEDHPAVARVAAIVEGLGRLEHEAVLNVQRAMRQHPLGPWVKAQRGIGEKQAARLLVAIGDPYYNSLHDRPRTVSELWAYCGFHVLPASHRPLDTQGSSASGAPSSGGDPGHARGDDHIRTAGVAPRRTRGQKSNWSEDARKRAWLIANSVVKAGGPYREIYDATKVKYADAVHTSPCVRCGPKGKPAPEGSALSKAHIHARGLRAISKAVLKDLWIESRRLHGVVPAATEVTP